MPPYLTASWAKNLPTPPCRGVLKPSTLPGGGRAHRCQNAGGLWTCSRPSLPTVFLQGPAGVHPTPERGVAQTNPISNGVPLQCLLRPHPPLCLLGTYLCAGEDSAPLLPGASAEGSGLASHTKHSLLPLVPGCSRVGLGLAALPCPTFLGLQGQSWLRATALLKVQCTAGSALGLMGHVQSLLPVIDQRGLVIHFQEGYNLLSPGSCRLASTCPGPIEPVGTSPSRGTGPPSASSAGCHLSKT